MKYKKLINFQALSEELTESRTKIKPTNTAEKYLDVLEDLDGFINLWVVIAKKKLKGQTKNNNMKRKNGFK
ncbi:MULTISPECIES: hypothetical protein [Flavobacterium]|uniref:Uncharacterized protein n=1 Tax=Flavobacterium keumense TaxID=1306518 RepID=A0ABY8N3B2_9FLAO|nr:MULTISPECIES: hypothetical protein [Flavobacterium]WGK93816.1 hypothetical protein MG292_06855 [Flavobacterium keumense]